MTQLSQLLPVTNNILDDEEVNSISARDLHKFLGVTERFQQWITKQFSYGFKENVDYSGCKIFNTQANMELQDYVISLDCAKQIAMLQRSPKGQEAREYFIECEKQLRKAVSSENQLILNTVLANTVEERMLAMGEYRTTIVLPLMEFKEQAQPKVEYHDDVLKAEGLMSVRQIAKDFGMTAQKLNKILHEKGIQFKQGGQWLLYKNYQDKGYTKSETFLTAEGSTVVNTKWTQKGRQFIYELLKGDEQ